MVSLSAPVPGYCRTVIRRFDLFAAPLHLLGTATEDLLRRGVGLKIANFNRVSEAVTLCIFADHHPICILSLHDLRVGNASAMAFCGMSTLAFWRKCGAARLLVHVAAEAQRRLQRKPVSGASVHASWGFWSSAGGKASAPGDLNQTACRAALSTKMQQHGWPSGMASDSSCVLFWLQGDEEVGKKLEEEWQNVQTKLWGREGLTTEGHLKSGPVHPVQGQGIGLGLGSNMGVSSSSSSSLLVPQNQVGIAGSPCHSGSTEPLPDDVAAGMEMGSSIEPEDLH